MPADGEIPPPHGRRLQLGALPKPHHDSSGNSVEPRVYDGVEGAVDRQQDDGRQRVHHPGKLLAAVAQNGKGDDGHPADGVGDDDENYPPLQRFRRLCYQPLLLLSAEHGLFVVRQENVKVRRRDEQQRDEVVRHNGERYVKLGGFPRKQVGEAHAGRAVVPELPYDLHPALRKIVQGRARVESVQYAAAHPVVFCVSVLADVLPVEKHVGLDEVALGEYVRPPYGQNGQKTGDQPRKQAEGVDQLCADLVGHERAEGDVQAQSGEQDEHVHGRLRGDHGQHADEGARRRRAPPVVVEAVVARVLVRLDADQ